MQRRFAIFGKFFHKIKVSSLQKWNLPIVNQAWWIRRPKTNNWQSRVCNRKELVFQPWERSPLLETDFSDIIACVQYSYVQYIQRHNFMATIAESRKMTRKLEKLTISDMNWLESTILKFRKRNSKVKSRNDQERRYDND